MLAIMGDDGVLTIPEEIMDRLGWTAGVEVEIEDRGDVVILRLVDQPATGDDRDAASTGRR